MAGVYQKQKICKWSKRQSLRTTGADEMFYRVFVTIFLLLNKSLTLCGFVSQDFEKGGGRENLISQKSDETLQKGIVCKQLHRETI